MRLPPMYAKGALIGMDPEDLRWFMNTRTDMPIDRAFDAIRIMSKALEIPFNTIHEAALDYACHTVFSFSQVVLHGFDCMYAGDVYPDWLARLVADAPIRGAGAVAEDVQGDGVYVP